MRVGRGRPAYVLTEGQTADWVKGNSSTIGPRALASFRESVRTMRIRAGWAIAFGRFARS